MRRIVPSISLALLLAISAHAQLLNQSIYPANADAKQDIKTALATAKAEHKRVLLVFGADWCYDCHVLDARFHEADIQPTVDKNFVVVHIDIGRGEKNVDVANKYNIPVDKGVPSIAVVGSSGAVLYSTQHGEISPTRRLSPAYILNFLQQWSPPKS
jgi:thiol:disulfide interchange protein